MNEEISLIFKSKVEPHGRFLEGLRLSAAFLGMDHIPLIIFLGDAVYGLKHNALSAGQLSDYLRAASDLAGISILDVDIEETGLAIAELDEDLNVKILTIDELSERLAESRVVVVF